MSSHALLRSVALPLALLVATAFAAAQDAPANPPSDAPKASPASAPADAKPIKVKVIEVKGDVRWAPADSKDWKKVEPGAEFPEQTQILTGIRSSVKLQFGDEQPYTCLLIDSVGRTVISEAYATQDTKRVRVGVAYGRVKGGVAEGGLKSDFTVDSPVATLSKRGTWGFSLFYERDTDAFEIGLSDSGLVDALNKLSGETRTVNPGEHVTNAMRLWLDQSQFRNVSIVDMFGQSDVELSFNRLEQDGLGVLNVGGGRDVLLNLSTPDARARFSDVLDRAIRNAPNVAPLDLGRRPVRTEGIFGTGRGDQLVEVLIDAGDSLSQKGLAKPGRYWLRRDAAESWLKSARR